VTEEERAELEALRAALGGPRALGPWLLWRALHAAAVVLPGPGTTSSMAAGVLPALRGTTSPGPVLPVRMTRDRVGSTRARGHYPAAAERLILDLCAGSGAWSEPYVAAGYRVQRVTLPDDDVRTIEPPQEPVWGVLAAPPCDQFSLARNGHPQVPRNIERGLEVVGACLRVIHAVRPRWWAVENPVGLLSRFLGTPRDVFQPHDFGDPWTKRTALWGDFTIPERGPFVEPLGGGPPCVLCDPERRRASWCSRADHRAVTPPGFARAFFEANP
jgi:hypothetical protein